MTVLAWQKAWARHQSPICPLVGLLAARLADKQATRKLSLLLRRQSLHAAGAAGLSAAAEPWLGAPGLLDPRHTEAVLSQTCCRWWQYCSC